MNGQPQTISNNSVYVLGAIINTLAVVDMNGLVDYSIKAIVGGCIWLAFKILGDYISGIVRKKNTIGKHENYLKQDQTTFKNDSYQSPQ